jgi:spoIIIJ-associated protein
MGYSCLDAGNFLESVLKSAGLSLSISLQEANGQCLLDIAGPDADLLQAEGGELLEALQHLLNQAFARKLPSGQRIVCDVHSFRATREAELRAMAQHAAGRVRSTGMAFTFSAMNANERRIIHLTLADSADLETESVGEGPDRKLRVALKSLPK